MKNVLSTKNFCLVRPAISEVLTEDFEQGKKMSASVSTATPVQTSGRTSPLRRAGSESGIQQNGVPSLSLTQKAFAAVILGSLAFVPLYGMAVLLKGFPKMPMIYAGLVGFVAAEYAGRHNIFEIVDTDEQEK